jgi:hypothetical protein
MQNRDAGRVQVLPPQPIRAKASDVGNESVMLKKECRLDQLSLRAAYTQLPYHQQDRDLLDRFVAHGSLCPNPNGSGLAYYSALDNLSF